MNYAVLRRNKLYGVMLEDPQRLLEVDVLKQLQSAVFPSLYQKDIARFIQFPSTNTEGIGTNKFYDLGQHVIHAISSSNILATSPRLVRVGDEHGTTFNGTTQSISFGNTGSPATPGANDVSFLSTEDWSLILSFSTTQSATDDFGKPLVGRDNADAVAQVIVRNNKVEFARKISSSWEHNIASTTSVDDGNPHVVAIVNDGNSQTATLYVDGVEEATGDSSYESGQYFAIDSLMTGANGVITGGTVFSILILAEEVDSTFVEQTTSFFTSGGLEANSSPSPVAPPAVSRYENQVFLMSTNDQPSVDIGFVPINSTDHVWHQSTTFRKIPMPTGGRFIRLTAEVDSDPGNDADTGLRFYILNTSTFDRGPLVDLLGTTRRAVGISSCMFQPSEFITLAVEKIGTPNAVGNIKLYSEVVPDIPGEMILLQRSITDSGGPSNAVPTYAYPVSTFQAKTDPYSTDQDSRISIMPCPGTLKKIYYWRDTVPQTGKSFAASFVNLDTSQKLTALLEDTNNLASNTVDTIAVPEGDRLTLEYVPTNTPVSRNGSISAVYVPDNDTEAPLLGGSVFDLDVTQTTYHYLWNAGFTPWGTSPNDRSSLFQDRKRLSDFYVRIDGVPAVGESFTVTVMRNSTGSWVDTSISVVVDDSGVTFSDISNHYDIQKNDNVTLKVVPSSPAAGNVKLLGWGIKLSDIPNDLPQEYVVNYLCRGMTSSTTFGLSAEVFAAGNVYRLVVATDSNFSNIVYESADTTTDILPFDEDARYFLRFDATGLTPETDYFYAIKYNGVIDLENVGRARTFPSENQAPANPNYRVCIISCSKPDQYPPDYQFPLCEDIAKENILTVIHLGDLLYHDISTDDLPLYRSATQSILKLPDFQLMLRECDFVYAKDDHDGGPDDYTLNDAGVTHFMPNAIQGSYDLVPTKPTDQPPGTSWILGTARSWNIGRTRCILPDHFIDKNENATPNPLILGDGTSQTVAEIGTFTTWDQKQWILDIIEAARVAGDQNILFLSTPRLSANGGNGYSSFPLEREWLVRAIVAADGPMVFHCDGDSHRSGTDTERLKAFMINATDGIFPGGNFSCLRSLGDGGLTSSEWDGVNTLSWMRVNTASGFDWVASGGNPGVYYAQISGGGPSNLGKARSIRFNNASKVEVEGVPPEDRWSYGDFDSLGYDELYVHITGGVDPQTVNVDSDYRELYGFIEFTDDGTEVFDMAIQHRSRANVPIRGVISRVSDQSPVITMDTPTDSVVENAGFIEIVIRRTWIGPWRCRVQTSDGAALAGTDYTAVDLVLDEVTHGNNGNSHKATVQIPIIDRSGAGVNGRSFTVTLSAPVPAGVSLGAGVTTTVSITN